MIRPLQGAQARAAVDPPGRLGVLHGSGGSQRVAFLVIRVAFLAVERRGLESDVGAVSGGVGGVGLSFGLGYRSGAFAMELLGRFGRHTFALKSAPPQQGRRTWPRRPSTRRFWSHFGPRER